MMFLPQQTQRGFTLVETIIVIVLVGAMMAGMTSLFMTSVGNSHRPFLRERALAVANAFMDEISRKRWNECTPIGGGAINIASGICPDGVTTPIPTIGSDAGESRASYDDIDDYHGLDQSPPQDSAGNDMPEYDGFTVTVSVTQPAGAWNTVPASDVRLITVSVTSNINETISVSSYRLNI